MDHVIFKDGLGERRRIANVSHTERLDVLCLDWELTSAPSFEAALRARIARLASFQHPQFANVRGVQRVGEPPSSTLAIASDATPGLRLSELLAAAEKKTIALDVGIAVFLIRQLVVAIAALHEDGEDLSHGAIALERLVLTPDARLVVVEHMLGPAIEELQFSHARLWKDLRVASPRTTPLPQLDQRSDVMQLGIVALSLILGRPIADDEYPGQIQDLVATAWAVSARGNLEPVPAGLRAWLGRAMQLDIRSSFGSAIDARTDLNKMFSSETALTAPSALKAFLCKQPAAAPVVVAVAPPPPPPPPLPSVLPEPELELEPGLEPEPQPSIEETHPPDVAIFDTPRPAPIVGPIPQPIMETPRPAPRIVEPTPKPPVVPPIQPFRPVMVAPTPEAVRISDEEGRQVVTRVRVHQSSKWVTAVAACALIVLASGGVFAARRYLKPPVAAASGRLAINTNPDGATVVVDGEPRGVTPLSLTVSVGSHVIELRGQGEPRRMSVNIDAGAEVSQYIELPKSAPTLGALQVKSDPGGARVTVDGIPRGVSPVTVAGLAPGEHTVLVEGEAGSTKQTVLVEPGVTAALTAQLSNQGAPASGWISVSAPAEVQLFENGRLVGSSQTDKLMVVAGSHQLEFVNAAIGYRATKTVQVSAGRTSTVKVEFPNGTIALNATPWADVWIDGTRIGETPIGNLPLTIGSHEIIFKHPDLGEQKHVAMVTLNAPTRLSVDMRKKQ